MIKKIIIFIIVIAICGISIMSFLDRKLDSDSVLYHYEGEILSDDSAGIHHSFSGKYTNNKEYNIYHDIHIRKKQNNIMSIVLHQINMQGSQTITLQDYSIRTGQGNHRLNIFEQEFLKKNKYKTLSGIQNLSGLESQSDYKKGVFIDILSLQGSYTNQLNQKNHYNIALKINCGLTQYITSKQKCHIDGEIGVDLPIDTYTKKWDIQGILYKE